MVLWIVRRIPAAGSSTSVRSDWKFCSWPGRGGSQYGGSNAAAGGSFDADGRDGVDWRCRDQAKGMLRWGRQAQEADSPGRRRQGVLLVES